MISDQDLDRLKEIFVTREEFTDLCIEMGEFKDEAISRQDTLTNQLDGFLGKLDIVLNENGAGAKAQYRHARQIQALAKGTGVVIPTD